LIYKKATLKERLVNMKVYCNREILSALKDIKFPKVKSEIIDTAKYQMDISEASIITLNQLDEKIFYTLDEVCNNVKIICSLELRRALETIKFPVIKSDIIEYLKSKKYPDRIIDTTDGLSDDIVYSSISEICE
jgi:hypothetical protein